MRIDAIINDQLVVDKILKHLNPSQFQAHSPPVSEETRIVEEAIYDFSFLIIFPLKKELSAILSFWVQNNY